MNSRRSAIVAAVSAIAIVLGSTLGATSAAADPTTFSISGQVTGADQGENLDSVTVEAYGAQSDVPVETTISSYGQFTLSGLVPGAYRLEASGDRLDTTWYTNATSYADATPVTVVDADVEGIQISMPLTTYVVSGTVSGGAVGNPLDGQSVELVVDGDQVVTTTTTDAQGHYALTSQAPMLSVSVHFVGGNGWAQEWYDGKFSRADATQFDLDADKTADVVLAKASTISGRVTQAASPKTSVAGADVTIDTAQGDYITDVVTDSEGNYTAPRIPGGSYKVSVQGPDRDDLGSQSVWATSWYGGGTRLGSAKTVTLASGGGETGINVALARDTKIAGTVTDFDTHNPLPGDAIDLDTAAGALVSQAFTDDSGHFQFDSVNPGTYRLRAEDAQRPWDFLTDATSWLRATTRTTSPEIRVAAGHVSSGENFALHEAGQTGGTFDQGLDSTPVAKTELLTTSGHLLQTGFLYSGQWGFSARPGTYRVRILPSDGYYSSQYWRGKSTLASSTKVTIVAGGFADPDAPHGTLDYQTPGSIKGSVKLAGGSAAGLTVTATRTQYYYGEATPDPVTVSSKGTFSFPNVPAGTYTITYGDGSDQPAQYPNRYPTQTAGVVTVKSGHTTSLSTQSMHDTVAITGTVSDADGPIGQADVDVYTTGGTWVATGLSNDDGTYEVDGVPSGKYKLHFTHGLSDDSRGDSWLGGEATFAASGVLDTSISTVADGTLAAGATITGIAVGASTKLPVDGMTLYVWREQPDGSWYEGSYDASSTDGTGHYVVRGLGVGTYKIRFSADPYDQYKTSWDGKSSTLEHATKVVVKSVGQHVTAPTAYLLPH